MINYFDKGSQSPSIDAEPAVYISICVKVLMADASMSIFWIIRHVFLQVSRSGTMAGRFGLLMVDIIILVLINIIISLHIILIDILIFADIQLSLSSRGLHGGAYFSDVSG